MDWVDLYIGWLKKPFAPKSSHTLWLWPALDDWEKENNGDTVTIKAVQQCIVGSSAMHERPGHLLQTEVWVIMFCVIGLWALGRRGWIAHPYQRRLHNWHHRSGWSTDRYGRWSESFSRWWKYHIPRAIALEWAEEGLKDIYEATFVSFYREWLVCTGEIGRGRYRSDINKALRRHMSMRGFRDMYHVRTDGITLVWHHSWQCYAVPCTALFSDPVILLWMFPTVQIDASNIPLPTLSLYWPSPFYLHCVSFSLAT